MSTGGNNGFERARILCQQRKWSLALDLLRDHLRSEPGHAEAHALFAATRMYAQPPDLAAARDEANEAVRLAPRDAYCLYIRALVAVRTDVCQPVGTPSNDSPQYARVRRLQARAIAEQSIEVSPDYLPPWHLLARIADDLADYVGMRAVAEKVLSMAPTDAEALALRAQSFLREQRWHEGLTAAELALQHAPADAALHYLAGWARLEIGDRRNAIANLAESLRLDPTAADAEAIYRRAILGTPLVDRVGQIRLIWMSFAAVCFLVVLFRITDDASESGGTAAAGLCGLGGIVGLAALVLIARDRLRARHVPRPPPLPGTQQR